MCAECLEEKHEGVIYGLHLGDYDFRYIGMSTKHKRRYSDHLKDAKGGKGYAIHDWIRKHGAENIQMTVIETFDEETIGLIEEREIFHIAQARAYYGKNLNMTSGGEGVKGISPEGRARMVAAITGRIHSPEEKAKRSASMRGRPVSAETREKIAAAQRGRKLSEEHKAKIKEAKRLNTYTGGKGITRNRPLGIRPTEEHRANLRAATGLGQHTRWHANRDIVNPACRFCTNANESQ